MRLGLMVAGLGLAATLVGTSSTLLGDVTRSLLGLHEPANKGPLFIRIDRSSPGGTIRQTRCLWLWSDGTHNKQCSSSAIPR
jgi:hypothetical protein